MAYNEARKRATIKYIKAAYGRIEVRVPKGQKRAVQAYAKAQGKSLNAYVKALIEADSGLSMGIKQTAEE